MEMMVRELVATLPQPPPPPPPPPPHHDSTSTSSNHPGLCCTSHSCSNLPRPRPRGLQARPCCCLQALRGPVRRRARSLHLGVRRPGRLQQQQLRRQGGQGWLSDQRKVLRQPS